MKHNQLNTCDTGVSSNIGLRQVATDLDELGKLAEFSLLVAFVLLGPQSTDENTLECSDCGRVYDDAVVCQSDDCPSNQEDETWIVYSLKGDPSFEVNALSAQDAIREALSQLGWSVMRKV